MQDLGTLGGTNSSALALNAAGQVVGTSDVSQAARHAFLYSNGSMIDLNSAISSQVGLTLTTATGINDLGQIVGTGVDANGNPHAFLLTSQGADPPTPTLGDPTPVPEPSTLALFGLAAAAALFRQARARCR
jgi:probable HAF family extracellular repeat protein